MLKILAQNTHMLNGNEIRLDERNVVVCSEHPNDAAMVDARDKDCEPVVQEKWLFLQSSRLTAYDDVKGANVCKTEFRFLKASEMH